MWGKLRMNGGEWRRLGDTKQNNFPGGYLMEPTLKTKRNVCRFTGRDSFLHLPTRNDDRYI